jgi:exopolysaccharide biosynthesis polyprenyl glycosylphosphotransferase
LAAASLAGAALIPLALAAVLYLRVVADSWLEERVLLIGSGPLAAELAENIARLRPFGLRVAGHLDDDDLCDVGGALGAHLGQLDQLEKVLRVFAIERVVVTLDAADTASIEEMLVSARLGGVCVESGAECGEWLLRQLPLAAPTRQLFLEGPGWETYWLYEAGKRAIDVAVAAAALVVAGPLIGLAALAIRLESPGPALFRQVRIGRRGRPFQIVKLRSMWVDAERHGYALATRGDPRITRLGGFLRRSRIDELPQLWNVLRGEMSLVGPRPERPELYDALADEFPLFRRRLAVRPGLTGWAQVHQGYVNDVAGFGIKLAYDLFYVKRRSLRIDLKIVWRTLRELMQLRGV